MKTGLLILQCKSFDCVNLCQHHHPRDIFGHNYYEVALPPAPNYGEARSAESNKDFIHKLKIALKEMNETRIWIKILMRAELIPSSQLASILNECEQLCRILSASVNTVKARINN